MFRIHTVAVGTALPQDDIELMTRGSRATAITFLKNEDDCIYIP
ncbi:MAG TPA: hypothetical protein VL098_02890 [Flavipsychrobacter sp.]|nr:hypothetical protein [Flavipsychrobacter sp.]